MTSVLDERRKLLRAVADGLADLPSVLKGGSALIFGYNLPRYSEDLDYNAEQAYNLEARITDAITSVGGTVQDITLRKDTDLVRRYSVRYDYGATRGVSFKIETSLRDPIKQEDVAVINGIRTYTIDALARQKLYAMRTDTGGRVAPRDLEDTVFIALNHHHTLSQETRTRIADLVMDGGSALLSRYQAAYQISPENSDDELLASIEALITYRKKLLGAQ